MYRAALFIDLDNTLVINPLGRLVMPKIYRLVAEATGRSFEEVAEIFKNEHLERVREGSPAAYDWDDILYKIWGNIGMINVSFLEELRAVCNEAVILDDAPEVLRILKRKGFYMILSTNGLWKYQECVLRETGLIDFFEEIITPDKRGCLKSSEKFYEAAPKYLEKISIGDNLIFDVYYPKLHGLKTIYVKRSSYVGEIYGQALGIRTESITPDAEILSLSQLPGVLDEILARRG
ncbi:MAG: HAD family hydrolase [Desulfurococcales archaeon]|nr:HAD family hydrolase [Desulfurococcales archaeon]